MENILSLNPTVCVVGKTYQIIVITERDALISVHVGEKTYYNHCNGIRISSAGVHKISVPAAELDKERSYTIVAQKMIKRLAYFPETGPEIEKIYKFNPLEKEDNINIYHLADVHNDYQQGINVVKNCEKAFDLLILNGDIASKSDNFEQMILCYKIASEVTKGEIPCIITRGNHELRGIDAENLDKYLPTDCGKSYYTFQTGPIWGMLLDAGEDKNDESPEYGGTICCHDFRLEQEKMIHNTIKNAASQYEEDGIKYKLIISHVPFTFKKDNPKFDIERELFSNWAKTIKDNIKPDLMLCGHIHKVCISCPGSEQDDLGHPCTVISGAANTPVPDNKYIITGTFININNNVAMVVANTENEILFEEKINLN